MANKMEEKRAEFTPAENKKLDLRIVKTKKILRSTLVKMLETDGIEDITVQELCRQANVNRMTFYKHYEDKHALLNDCFNEIGNVITENMEKHYASVTTPEDYCYGLLQELSEFCLDNRKFIKAVLSGSNSCTSLLSKGLQNMFVSLLTRFFKECEEKGELTVKKDDASIACLAAFITGGIENVAVYWVNNPDAITRQSMLESFAPVIKAVFDSASTELPVFPTPDDDAPAKKGKRKYTKRKKAAEL